jgi:hypothetical protein
MSDPDTPEDLTPAEQALDGHLALLRSDAPQPPATMDLQIVRRARWQRSVRRPLFTIGHFVAAIRDGIRLLLVPADRR